MLKADLHIKIILLVVFIPVFLTAQDKEEAIRVNNNAVSINEFNERLNFVPEGYQSGSALERKENLAASIIAEKIFSEEAKKDNLDTINNVKVTIHEYEREAVYEEWMKREVTDKIKLQDDELRKVYPKFREQRVVDYLVFPDNLSAQKTYDCISGGNKLSSFQFSNENDKLQSKTISFGESLPEVEDCIYSLKENTFSPVIKLGNEFYIFRLKKILPHPEYSTQKYEYWKPSIEKIIKARQTLKNFENLMPGMMHDKAFRIKKENFEFIIKQLSETLKFGKDENIKFPESANLELAVTPDGIESKINEPLVNFSNGEVWTIGDVWQKLRFGPYLLNYESEELFRNDFTGLLRRMVLFETVIKDGYRKGYNKSDYVKQQTDMWGDDLLSKLYQFQLSKNINITEDDIQQYYSSNQSRFRLPEMCRILEILVYDKTLADSLMDRIKAGEDFLGLAKQFSKRSISGQKIEDGIYIAINTWGEIGKAAFAIDPGKTYGPIDLGEKKYSIIKSLERIDNKYKKLDEVHDDIYNELLKEKTHLVSSDILKSLVDKYSIKINKKVMMKAKTIEGNMFVKKSHFPNRMIVPLTNGFSSDEQWFNKISKAQLIENNN